MQLEKKGHPISLALATATTALLGGAGDAQAASDHGWDIDTAALYYGEQDGRVQDTSLSIRVAKRFEDERSLVAGLSMDSLTGATPNGAVPLDQPQTFTRPSGKSRYRIDAGELPLDDTFRDTRTAAYASWTQPFGEVWSANVGLTFSTEYDYVHAGINGSVSHELNRGNTTLSAGFAYAADEWSPVGGVPIPLAPMQDTRNSSSKEGDTADKTVADVLLGVSQVVNERVIVQLNYSFSRSDGYLNDPYKILTVLDETGEPLPGPGRLFLYLYESRPDNRAKHGLFAKVKAFLAGGALDTSYRFMTDDWGIASHTIDTRYRFNFTPRQYVEPHLRWYRQSAADFHHANLSATEFLPVFASADYRLAAFTGLTAGMKYGLKIGSAQEISLRAEWYNQSGDSTLHRAPADTNVFPELNALIVQLSYRISF